MRATSTLKAWSKQRRRLLLLSFDWTRPKDPPISLAQASLLAKLNEANLPVIPQAWAVNNEQFKLNDVVQFVKNHAVAGTDLAMGAYVWHEPQTQALLQAIRETQFPGRIILGGPQISYTKQGLEGFYPQADIFVRGYGEDALAALCSSTDDKPVIPGVHYAGDDDLGLSSAVDLTTLPSPYLTGVIKPQPFIRWETQRGCLYHCAFCQYREPDASMKRTQFSLQRLRQETDWILSHSEINDISVIYRMKNIK